MLWRLTGFLRNDWRHAFKMLPSEIHAKSGVICRFRVRMEYCGRSLTAPARPIDNRPQVANLPHSRYPAAEATMRAARSLTGASASG
jgi:hypothetical protein